MDPQRAWKHLTMAERRVRLGEKHIAQQIQAIERLKRKGHPTELAIAFLNKLQSVQALCVQRRDCILDELADEANDVYGAWPLLPFPEGWIASS